MAKAHDALEGGSDIRAHFIIDSSRADKFIVPQKKNNHKLSIGKKRTNKHLRIATMNQLGAMGYQCGMVG